MCLRRRIRRVICIRTRLVERASASHNQSHPVGCASDAVWSFWKPQPSCQLSTRARKKNNGRPAAGLLTPSSRRCFCFAASLAHAQDHFGPGMSILEEGSRSHAEQYAKYKDGHEDLDTLSHFLPGTMVPTASFRKDVIKKLFGDAQPARQPRAPAALALSYPGRVLYTNQQQDAQEVRPGTSRVRGTGAGSVAFPGYTRINIRPGGHGSKDIAPVNLAGHGSRRLQTEL